jgi:hypothetical protein
MTPTGWALATCGEVGILTSKGYFVWLTRGVLLSRILFGSSEEFCCSQCCLALHKSAIAQKAVRLSTRVFLTLSGFPAGWLPYQEYVITGCSWSRLQCTACSQWQSLWAERNVAESDYEARSLAVAAEPLLLCCPADLPYDYATLLENVLDAGKEGGVAGT